MNSRVELITSMKTAHVRELVQIQKPKKIRPKRKMNAVRSYNPLIRNSDHLNNYASNKFNVSYNHDNTNHNPCQVNHFARGYDSVKIKSSILSKRKGFVTDELKACVENLCSGSTVGVNNFVIK